MTFAYPANPDKPVLRNFSLRIQPHKFNAFAGLTGSGKSTIVELILKFYEPQSGAITLAGTDLRRIDAAWLRQRIGYVGQDPILFSGTVRENVAVGATPSDEEVAEALRRANLLEFVRTLPGATEFDVGDGGARLSGGQKQRLAIARALARRPRLLILDEATSALDGNSERAVQGAVEEGLASGRLTVICIAHRLKTIVKADRIWCIHNGAITHQGTFAEIEKFKHYDCLLR